MRACSSRGRLASLLVLCCAVGGAAGVTLVNSAAWLASPAGAGGSANSCLTTLATSLGYVAPGASVAFSRSACGACGRERLCPDSASQTPGGTRVSMSATSRLWDHCGSGGTHATLSVNGSSLGVTLCNSQPSAGLVLVIVLPSLGFAAAVGVVTYRVLRPRLQVPAKPLEDGDAQASPTPAEPDAKV